MKVNLLSGKGDINMEIKAKKLITDLKNKQPTEMKKKIYVHREDFKDFCRCEMKGGSCPCESHPKWISYGSSGVKEVGRCVNCPVGIIEDHDNEIRQELYDDIRKKLLG